MPKIPDIQIHYEDPMKPANHRSGKSFSASVSVEGLFRAQLPEEYKDVAYHLFPPPDYKEKRTRAMVDVWRGRYYLASDKLADLEIGLRKLLEEYHKVSEVVEIVILFNVKAAIAFSINEKTQEIHQNGEKGRWLDDYLKADLRDEFGRKKATSFFETVHATSPAENGYSLMIGARVMRKITLTRGTQTTINYKTIGWNDDEFRDNESIQELNAWCSFTLDKDRCEEIPYTPEAAHFFHQMMMGLAKLSMKLFSIMKNKETLLEAIQKSTLSLTFDGDKEKTGDVVS